MRRVHVFSPDLLFFSQVQHTVGAAGWTTVRWNGSEAPGDASGDGIVIDATRELERAWAALKVAVTAGASFTLVCHQHKEMQVGEEALARGATDAARRGALLTRLAELLGSSAPGTGAPFVGKPPA